MQVLARVSGRGFDFKKTRLPEHSMFSSRNTPDRSQGVGVAVAVGVAVGANVLVGGTAVSVGGTLVGLGTTMDTVRVDPNTDPD